MPKSPTVLVAMSGGVDSSVAAALLVKRGYDVIGMTMQIWQESQTDSRHAGCCSLGAVEDARRVARVLGIPHYVVNMKEDFKNSVIDRFVDGYRQGKTPNPCVECNRSVKFEVLLSKALELGCDKLATGHYARVRRNSQTGGHRLLKARASDKDQSYVLYMLGQSQLSRVMFPMGELPSKAYARQIARQEGLHLADKQESQDICFVSEAGGYREFLRKADPKIDREGEIVDENGKVLGFHEGVAGFTIGQRKGIGISHRKPLYVIRIDGLQNRVVVGDAELLESREAELESLHWPEGSPSEGPQNVLAKIRYNMEPMPARLFPGPKPKLVFKQPVRAVTPGQIAVAYKGQRVLAGGEIGSLPLG